MRAPGDALIVARTDFRRRFGLLAVYLMRAAELCSSGAAAAALAHIITTIITTRTRGHACGAVCTTLAIRLYVNRVSTRKRFLVRGRAHFA